MAVAVVEAGKYGMTRKLENLFDLPPSVCSGKITQDPIAENVEQTSATIMKIELAIDKIDAALPAVKDLDTSDQELDEIATKATETFNDLTDLGFNVDSRYSAELFAVASTMLGHALTAKTTKLQKKLKVLELQMKKLKLDQDQANKTGDGPVETAHGQILSRNDLLERLMTTRDQNNTKA